MALAEYGPRVLIVNIDTGSEHPDNERFRADCERWFNHPIITIKSDKYEDVDDVLTRTRYINGPAGARCTAELKKAVRHGWERPDDLHVWGYAMDERDKKRAERFVADNPGVDSWFPLIERGLSKSTCLAMVQRAGIALPIMYEMGYTNNNCIGCVKGGKGYWNKIREDFPEVFERRAAQEREINHSCINGTFLDELVPGTGRYKPETIECDLNCQPVMDEWVPVRILVPKS